MKFDFYEDPGHGWLKVKKSLIKELGIQDNITPYSYIRGDYVYLEEDCDFSTFVKAMKDVDKTVELRIHHTNKTSKIRNYQHYCATYINF